MNLVGCDFMSIRKCYAIYDMWHTMPSMPLDTFKCFLEVNKACPSDILSNSPWNTADNTCLGSSFCLKWAGDALQMAILSDTLFAQPCSVGLHTCVGILSKILGILLCLLEGTLLYCQEPRFEGMMHTYFLSFSATMITWDVFRFLTVHALQFSQYSM
jgi:hypothetical protein